MSLTHKLINETILETKFKIYYKDICNRNGLILKNRKKQNKTSYITRKEFYWPEIRQNMTLKIRHVPKTIYNLVLKFK